MSAERLREAARVLRHRAQYSVCPCGGPVCTTDKWFRSGELYARFDGSARAVPFIEMMSPNVGLALADWLDKVVARDPRALSVEAEPALEVAEAILGGVA